MSKNTLAAFRVLPLSLLLSLSVALSACGPVAEPGPAPAQSGGASPGAQANAGHEDADMRFAVRMRELHQRTVELGDLLMEKEGVNADVLALATKIKAVHEPEIAQLQGMLRAWGELSESGNSPSTTASAGEPTAAGTGALEELRAAEGEAAGQLYLELMIAHHEASMAVAEEEIAAGANAEAIALAETISTTQQQEIERMRALQR